MLPGRQPLQVVSQQGQPDMLPVRQRLLAVSQPCLLPVRQCLMDWEGPARPAVCCLQPLWSGGGQRAQLVSQWAPAMG